MNIRFASYDDAKCFKCAVQEHVNCDCYFKRNDFNKQSISSHCNQKNQLKSKRLKVNIEQKELNKSSFANKSEKKFNDKHIAQMKYDNNNNDAFNYQQNKAYQKEFSFRSNWYVKNDAIAHIFHEQSSFINLKFFIKFFSTLNHERLLVVEINIVKLRFSQDIIQIEEVIYVSKCSEDLTSLDEFKKCEITYVNELNVLILNRNESTFIEVKVVENMLMLNISRNAMLIAKWLIFH